ncbi:MAG: hypothetical protein QF775_01775 [archaeon]|nr:hypothetical protein [archaeon]
MMKNEEIIQKVIDETDVNLLENCTIEDIEGIVNTIMAEALLEIGDQEDDT